MPGTPSRPHRASASRTESVETSSKATAFAPEIFEAESHLCGARAPVEGREHDPERLAGPVEDGRLIAVLEQDQQPVALREAQPRQTAGYA